MGELEQHVAVRDLLIPVDRNLQDDSGCRLTTRPCPPFSAGVMAQYPPTTSATQNASCRAFHFGLEAGTCRRLYRPRGGAAAAQNPAWFIWSESRSGRSQRQPFDAAPRFLDPLRCRSVRGAWNARAQD